MDIHAVADLGRALKKKNYQFITVTPETHRRILSRSASASADPLREFFGWNRILAAPAIPKEILQLAEGAGVIEEGPRGLQSRVRFSTLGDDIFLHSSYPTVQDDAVFFGPDSYRFVRFVKDRVKHADQVLDLGCGSGVGGLSLRRDLAFNELFLSDISPRALEFARVNTALAGVCEPKFLTSDLLANIPNGIDTIIANPPFVIDQKHRLYRHGGDGYGTGLSVEIVAQALRYLPPGGQLALYTGTAVVAGKDVFLQRISDLQVGFEFSYQEIDPDIFGEELDGPNYQDVERIAAVGLYVRKPSAA